MARSALPKYYTQSKELLEDFSNFSAWAKASGSGGTIAENSTYVVEGNKSLQVTSAETNRVTVQKTINEVFDGENDIFLRFWLPEDYATTLNYLTVLFTTEPNFTDTTCFYRNFSVSAWPILQPGWNLLALNAGETSMLWNKAGTISWADAMKTLCLKVSPLSGKIATVIFDALYIRVKRKPLALITFDDGCLSQYTVAFQLLKERGLKSTHYVVKNFVGTNNYMNEAQLEEMYADGLAIGNHATTHTQLATLTYSQIYNELNSCYQYLLSLGFDRSADHVAYPGGSYNTDVGQAMLELGMKTGRLVTNGLYPQYGKRLYSLTTYGMGSGTSLAAMKGYVDTAIQKGAVIGIYGHEISDTPSSTAWSATDLEALLDYIVERRLETVTIDEFYEGLTNPRYRSLPLSRATV